MSARPWQGGGEPRAGGNWIPEDRIGDLQLGGTGNESGLLARRLQTLGRLRGKLAGALSWRRRGNLCVLGQQRLSGIQLVSGSELGNYCTSEVSV